jgi:hypothetical protein
MRVCALSRAAALVCAVMGCGLTPGQAAEPVQEHEVQDHLTFHRRSVEIPNDPRRIDWIKLDISDALKLHDAQANFEVLHQQHDPYRRHLPFESRHSKQELDELRKNPAKFYDVYYRELEEVLKDRFYAWEELNRMASTLEEMRRAGERPYDLYVLRVRFKEPVNGMAQVNYALSGYLEAKTMADDIRQGVIKSFTVYADNLSGLPSDPKVTWEPCGSACWISAFGF